MTGHETKPAPLKIGAPMTKEEREAAETLHSLTQGYVFTEVSAPWPFIDATAGNLIESD